MAARRWYALLVVGSAAFTLFGSLVPFEFRDRDLGEAAASFSWAMTSRVAVQSRSDGLANVMLGVPLGFGLLGMLCADRRDRRRAILLGLVVLPGCMLFAGMVEFAQLFVPARTCAGSDVLAQTLGAALGMAAWVVFGQRVTGELRKATTGADRGIRFLIGYVLLLGFMQALPFDLTLSPADAYRKFRDGGVNPIPFGEFRTLAGDDALGRVAGLLKLAGLYLPVGLLAGFVPGRFWADPGKVALAALTLVVGIELGQVLVKSRTPSATDVVVGAAAAFFGWLIVVGFGQGRNFHQLAAAFAGWWGLLFWVSWQPFAVGEAVAFDWVPGMPLEGGHPLNALEEMLTKLVLFGLGGAALASSDLPRAGAVAVAVGLATSAACEAGQTRFLGHDPGITDVLLGGLGALCGAWAANKVRGERPA